MPGIVPPIPDLLVVPRFYFTLHQRAHPRRALNTQAHGSGLLRAKRCGIRVKDLEVAQSAEAAAVRVFLRRGDRRRQEKSMLAVLFGRRYGGGRCRGSCHLIIVISPFRAGMRCRQDKMPGRISHHFPLSHTLAAVVPQPQNPSWGWED